MRMEQIPEDRRVASCALTIRRWCTTERKMRRFLWLLANSFNRR